MKNSIELYFKKQFGLNPDIILRAPGRINIIGEHLDYNNGFVMPCAIDKSIFFGLSKRSDKRVVLYSLDFDALFSSDDIGNLEITESHWSNHILGVVKEIISRGKEFPFGFNLCFGGDIPIGAGVSSSAAVEVGTALGLSSLFDFRFSKLELAFIAQATEHKYIGVNCGIMDMYASIFSQKNSVIELDCENLTHRYIPAHFDAYKFILVNTGVKHSLASSAYNKRRLSCEKGLLVLQGKTNLKNFKEISEQQLFENQEFINREVFEKCLYVIQEINRVKKSSQCLVEGDFKRLGENIYQSHLGLSKLFEVSCPELDFLAEEAMQLEGVLGSRMHGGGFGGCTLNLVKKGNELDIINTLSRKYEEKYQISPSILSVEIDDGASIL